MQVSDQVKALVGVWFTSTGYADHKLLNHLVLRAARIAEPRFKMVQWTGRSNLARMLRSLWRRSGSGPFSRLTSKE